MLPHTAPFAGSAVHLNWMFGQILSRSSISSQQTSQINHHSDPDEINGWEILLQFCNLIYLVLNCLFNTGQMMQHLFRWLTHILLKFGILVINSNIFWGKKKKDWQINFCSIVQIFSLTCSLSLCHFVLHQYVQLLLSLSSITLKSRCVCHPLGKEQSWFLPLRRGWRGQCFKENLKFRTR